MILGGVKKSKKRLLIIVALALLACLVWLVWRGSQTDELVAESIPDTSGGPSFEVRVVVPRAGLPLGGILPEWLVKKHDLTPRELRFDYTSPGAQIGTVAPNRLELKADGWDLHIETNGDGQVAPGTYLVFPLGLGGRRMRLNCRPADLANGYLRTTTRAGTGEIGGRFLVELANCKNAESGKTSDWPPAPLTVRGSFVGPPTRPSPEPSLQKK